MAEKTPVGDMPRMVPDRDDIRRRVAPAQAERKPNVIKKEPDAKGSSWLMAVLLIVAGIAIGYLALQQYSLTQLLNSYEERLELADERIVSLEQSLTQTDESVALNGTAINAQFKAIKSETDLHMSEIRKLWDVTNKRNKTWIEENQANLAAQTKTVAALEASIKTLETGQTSGQAEVVALKQQLDEQIAVFAKLEQQISQTSEEMATVNRAIESLINGNYEERLLTLTLNQENLLAELGKADQQSTANADQISEMMVTLNAIDTGRLETNQRLSALSTRLDTLNAKVTALTGTSQ